MKPAGLRLPPTSLRCVNYAVAPDSKEAETLLHLQYVSLLRVVDLEKHTSVVSPPEHCCKSSFLTFKDCYMYICTQNTSRPADIKPTTRFRPDYDSRRALTQRRHVL